jgi:hypothetical protein
MVQGRVDLRGLVRGLRRQGKHRRLCAGLRQTSGRAGVHVRRFPAQSGRPDPRDLEIICVGTQGSRKHEGEHQSSLIVTNRFRIPPQRAVHERVVLTPLAYFRNHEILLRLSAYLCAAILPLGFATVLVAWLATCPPVCRCVVGWPAKVHLATPGSYSQVIRWRRAAPP